MRLLQLFEGSTNYFHGSYEKLPIGMMLNSQPDYEYQWGSTIFYNIFKMTKPENMLGHDESVFMVDNIDDIDNAGASTDYVYRVMPDSRIERHDMAWGSILEMYLDDNNIYDLDKLSLPENKEITEWVKRCAYRYWAGVPNDRGEAVWEYLTPTAKIIEAGL